MLDHRTHAAREVFSELTGCGQVLLGASVLIDVRALLGGREHVPRSGYHIPLNMLDAQCPSMTSLAEHEEARGTSWASSVWLTPSAPAVRVLPWCLIRGRQDGRIRLEHRVASITCARRGMVRRRCER
jgi:hypothetical protein